MIGEDDHGGVVVIPCHVVEGAVGIDQREVAHPLASDGTGGASDKGEGCDVLQEAFHVG